MFQRFQELRIIDIVVIRRIKSIEPVVKVSAGLDVHRKNVMATILSEQDDKSLQEITCEFGTFLKNRKQLRGWL